MATLTESYIEAAGRLAPQIEAAAVSIEREGQLPSPVVTALIEAGFFKMLVPREFGGAELDLMTYARVIEDVAKADASTAWCLSQSASTGMVAAYLDPKTAGGMVAGPGAILSHSHGPGCRATEMDGGYRVTARWTYGTTCHHATWLSGDVAVDLPEGAPKLRADGSRELVTLYFPATDAEIVDSWNVSGLRGTGSDSFVTRDLFVPKDRMLPLPRERPLHQGVLYVCPMRFFYASGFASVALGLARAMLDAYEDLAANKVPRVASRVLRDNAVVQSDAGRAEARLRAARAFLHQTIVDVWRDVERTHETTLEHRVLMRLATTHAIQEASHVADAIHRAAGGNAIIADQPFDRRFRDMHAVTQHVQGNQVHYEATGQYFLGLDPDHTWL